MTVKEIIKSAEAKALTHAPVLDNVRGDSGDRIDYDGN